MASLVGRRQFLASVAALGAGSVSARLAAQSPALRVDTHHHVFPPPYVAGQRAAGINDGFAARWTVDATLEDMAAAGVGTAVLSVTSPATTFAEPPVARRLARESNEWVARLAQDHPGRFGLFALVPMPSVDDTLQEIEYALDVLKADGIGFMTSYGDRWLGHPSFAPVMAELQRRGAVVYTHPTNADCCRNLQPGIPSSVIEFGTDTSRTITDVVFSGTAARCADVRFIFSHAGGTLPYLTERLVRMPLQNTELESRVPNGVLYELQRFYYDTAWSAHPGALASLTRLVRVSQILFGSDYPYRTGSDHVSGLSDYGFSSAELRSIGYENARRLLPGLGSPGVGL